MESTNTYDVLQRQLGMYEKTLQEKSEMDERAQSEEAEIYTKYLEAFQLVILPCCLEHIHILEEMGHQCHLSLRLDRDLLQISLIIKLRASEKRVSLRFLRARGKELEILKATGFTAEGDVIESPVTLPLAELTLEDIGTYIILVVNVGIGGVFR